MSATMQDPGAQEPERDREASETEQQEQREHNLTRLDTILRTYTPRELAVARDRMHAYPDNKALAIEQVRDTLTGDLPQGEYDLRAARDLVDAVAEADGAYEHAVPEPLVTPQASAIPPCSTCGAPATHAARDMYRIDDPTSTGTVDRFQPGEMKTGCDAHPVESRTFDAVPGGHAFFEHPIIQEGIKLHEDGPSPTQRAIDDFLGTGTHRTAALRGFLRFLTQEDLSTVLAECCVQIDDEHLQHTVRMLGPDDLQAVSFAAAGEVSTRMLDAGGGTRDFPLRPLEPHEHREPVDFSENGNPLLEKDVQLAVEMLGRFLHQDEGVFTEHLERDTGWNSIYAGEVAQEAWTRYYHERDTHE